MAVGRKVLFGYAVIERYCVFVIDKKPHGIYISVYVTWRLFLYPDGYRQYVARKRRKGVWGTAMKNCMLENLKSIMILLRSDIRNRRGKELVHLCHQAFQNQMSNGEMCEKMIEMMPAWQGWLNCGETPDWFVQEDVAAFINMALEVMEETLHAGEFEMAYDLADLLHVVPDVIAKNDKASMKRYWKVFVVKFHQKWNCNIFHKFY